MGRQGRWQEAAADAAVFLENQPSDQYRYHILAALLAMTHNRPAFERLCQRILPLFANTTNPYIAERAADDCLVLPNSGVDLRLVDALATKALTNGNNDSAAGYFQACKALLDYRLGHFPEAVDWAERSLGSSQVFAASKGCAVLAMAQWQLGQKDAARAMLAKGDILTPSISPAREAVDIGDSWVAWIFARTALEEAAQLIKPGSTTNAALNKP
jgi:tetratricopeptide (TPR) repeat protein